MSKTISQLTGHVTAGEVGVEVEMEGKYLPAEIPRYWRVEGDGSLRNGLEYVLKRPYPREDIDNRIDHLFQSFNDAGAKLDPTFRTSIHIHLNVQEFTEVQVYNFICLYLILEDALVKWCGNEREGNLFCLRAKDAEFLIDILEKSAHLHRLEYLDTDNIRYAALNCKALWRYGSLEFRSMRGTAKPDLIKQWVKILLKLKDAALKYNSPVEIVDGFSEGGEAWFCENILQEYFEELCSYPDWDAEVYGGIRRVQCIAYGGYWNRKQKEGKVAKAKEKGRKVGGMMQGGALIDPEWNHQEEFQRIVQRQQRDIEMLGMRGAGAAVEVEAPKPKKVRMVKHNFNWAPE